MKVTKEFLQHKLSPDANPDQVDELRAVLEQYDLTTYARPYKGGNYIVLIPKQFFRDLYGREGHNLELRDLGRSLLALYWERSALHGNTIYIKKLEEYNEFGY